MQSLSSYDRDLIALMQQHNFDLSVVAYERYITYQQLFAWSRTPHIAHALEEVRQQTKVEKPPQPAGAST
jgi:hypothetical protein